MSATVYHLPVGDVRAHRELMHNLRLALAHSGASQDVIDHVAEVIDDVTASWGWDIDVVARDVDELLQKFVGLIYEARTTAITEIIKRELELIELRRA